MTASRKPASPILFEHECREYRFENLCRAYRQAGIGPGDTIFVHSDLKSFGRLGEVLSRDDYAGWFVRAFLEVLGKKGTMIVPTFSYSFCKGEDFDIANTPSTIGILPEYFRKMEGVGRSRHPIFSVAAFGPKAEIFLQSGKSCFGDDSIFYKLQQGDVKLVFLGDTFHISLLHRAETVCRVPYRYTKYFSGKVIDRGQASPVTVEYFVKYLDRGIAYDFSKIAGYLVSKGIINTVALGNSLIRVLPAREAFTHLVDAIRQDPYFLLEKIPDLGGARPT